VEGKPILYHPILLKGKGKISFGRHVSFGVKASPLFYSHYVYLEARTEDSEIIIGDNVAISNGFSVEANATITIKNNVLIGVNCSITDNDGHHLEPERRSESNLKALPVVIG
jgi:maltose O-acetyltransferase